MLRKILLNLVIILLSSGGMIMALEIESPAFKNNEFIPKKYTCQGQDISLPLSWKGAPEGTKSFALINDDPDAPMGTWVHWLVYDIPAETSSLSEGIPSTPSLDDGSKQGYTNFARVGYGGPCPPPGEPHRYFFRLYALDAVLGLAEALRKSELLKSIEGHILAEAELIGLYKR